MKEIKNKINQIIELKKEISELKKEQTKELGSKLRILRKKHKMTQEKLCVYLGMTRTQVTNIEAGRTTPTVHTLISICNLFDISADDFLFNELTL